MKDVISERKIFSGKNLSVLATDPKNPNYGNASHWYKIQSNEKYPRQVDMTIRFQEGPIKERGINGIDQETLLAILIDRLSCFQESKFACEENSIALDHLRKALEALEARTQKRELRGVEGKNII